MRIELPERHGAVGVRAANPGLLTLEGTNSWVVGDEGAWVIDPGPALTDHLDALERELEQRGGMAGIALTHGHADHSEAVPVLIERLGEVPVVRSGPGAGGGASQGPLEVLELPGHSADHVAFVGGGVAYTGDAIFAHSSVYVAPGRGSLSGYLAGLEALAALGPELIAPGHGPLIEDPVPRIRWQIAHRLERERRLIEALDEGSATVPELLAVVWDDVPEQLLPAATVTLAAHLDKLEEEGRSLEGVERPDIPEWVV